MDPTIIGLISALAGGVVVKLVEQFFASRTAKAAREQEGDSLRIKELRDEITSLKQERDSARSKEVEWTQKYFDLLGSVNQIKSRVGPTSPEAKAADNMDPNMILDMVKQLVGGV